MSILEYLLFRIEILLNHIIIDGNLLYLIRMNGVYCRFNVCNCDSLFLVFDLMTIIIGLCNIAGFLVENTFNFIRFLYFVYSHKLYTQNPS